MALRNWSFTRVVGLCLAAWVLAFAYISLMADFGVRETGLAWLPFVILTLLPCIILPVWASRSVHVAAWHPGRFVLLWATAALVYMPLARWRVGGLVAFVAAVSLLGLTWFGIEHRLRRR
jgi:hypothetical protein